MDIIDILKVSESIKVLKANYPDSKYTMLRDAVDTAIEVLERHLHATEHNQELGTVVPKSKDTGMLTYLVHFKIGAEDGRFIIKAESIPPTARDIQSWEKELKKLGRDDTPMILSFTLLASEESEDADV